MIDGYIRFVRKVLPSPFSIAIVLTGLSFLFAFALGFARDGEFNPTTVFGWWGDGLWNPPLLVFAMQMMLMLVLGHALALTPTAAKAIKWITGKCNNTAQAAFIVSFSALCMGLFNWGLGLIFGAILARKVGEHFSAKQAPLNYALIGAAGYSALMNWHGGISGSALIKVAEHGNLVGLLQGSLSESQLELLPSAIGLGQTVFSIENLIVNLIILLSIPCSLYLIGKKLNGSKLDIAADPLSTVKPKVLIGAEHIDHSTLISRIVGVSILLYCLYLTLFNGSDLLSFFNPNNINLLLFGLCLSFHRNFNNFILSVGSAIGGASGILIQFPLYFGIMGLFKDSGMIGIVSDFFVSISTELTFPIFTYISAGLVNIFVPSGGGQWVIQGPIIVKAALELGIPLNKSILALAYGDQITNMLQPFWALPLLGITKLMAKDILPYTLVMFVVGFVVYLLGIIVF